MPEPHKPKGLTVADHIRRFFGDPLKGAGKGQGSAGQDRRKSIDKYVDEAEKGRQRAAQTTDRINGY